MPYQSQVWGSSGKLNHVISFLSRHGFPCLWWFAPRATRQKRTLHLCHLQIFFCRAHDFRASARLLVEVSRFLPAAWQEWEWTVRVKQSFNSFYKSLDQVTLVVHQAWHCLRSRIFGRCVKHIGLPPRPRPDILRKENEASWHMSRAFKDNSLWVDARRFRSCSKYLIRRRWDKPLAKVAFQRKTLKPPLAFRKRNTPEDPARKLHILVGCGGTMCDMVARYTALIKAFAICKKSVQKPNVRNASSHEQPQRTAFGICLEKLLASPLISLRFAAQPQMVWVLMKLSWLLGTQEARGCSLKFEILFPSDKWQMAMIWHQPFCKGAGEKLCRPPMLFPISFNKTSWSIYLSTPCRCSLLMALSASCDLVLGL